jgi:hypothetical protein
MAKKRRKPQLLSDQLREIIEGGPVTRYRLSKEARVDASQLCRFVQRKGRLTTDSLDRIGEVLRLRLVQDPE